MVQMCGWVCPDPLCRAGCEPQGSGGAAIDTPTPCETWAPFEKTVYEIWGVSPVITKYICVLHFKYGVLFPHTVLHLFNAWFLWLFKFTYFLILSWRCRYLHCVRCSAAALTIKSDFRLCMKYYLKKEKGTCLFKKCLSGK